MRFRSKYLIALCFICACYSCSSQEVSPLFPCTGKLDNPYGITCHFTQTHWDEKFQDEMIPLIKNAGITNVRNDYWLPYESNFRQSELVKVIENSTNKNQKSGLRTSPTLYVGQKNDRPWDKVGLYEETLEYYLQQYGQFMKSWEVFNEIDIAGSRDGIEMDSVANAYMKILPQTYEKIKRNNPQAIVTSSGAAYVNSTLLRELCKREAYKYFDILNIHLYDSPENLPIYFKRIRSLMDEYGWEKNVWMTECGYSTEQSNSNAIGYNAIKETKQAQYLPRTFLISYAYGLDKVFWYSMRSRESKKDYSEDHYGILHADLAAKPAYYAYKTLTTMCPSGSTRPTLSQAGNSYLCSWKTNKNKRVWAVWNSKRDKNFDFMIKGKCAFYDHLGNKINKPETYGQGVVYIVGAKSVTFE